MNLPIFSVFLAIAFLFILAGAISKDRINIIPGALMFLLLGSILTMGTSIEYQTGTDLIYEDVNGSMEVVEEQRIYSEFKPPTPIGQDRFNEAIGISMIAIGLYYFLISISHVNFRSSISKRN